MALNIKNLLEKSKPEYKSFTGVNDLQHCLCLSNDFTHVATDHAGGLHPGWELHGWSQGRLLVQGPRQCDSDRELEGGGPWS